MTKPHAKHNPDPPDDHICKQEALIAELKAKIIIAEYQAKQAEENAKHIYGQLENLRNNLSDLYSESIDRTLKVNDDLTEHLRETNDYRMRESQTKNSENNQSWKDRIFKKIVNVLVVSLTIGISIGTTIYVSSHFKEFIQLIVTITKGLIP